MFHYFINNLSTIIVASAIIIWINYAVKKIMSDIISGKCTGCPNGCHGDCNAFKNAKAFLESNKKTNKSSI